MRRGLSNVAVAVSLALCVAIVVLWVRGRERGEMLGWWEYQDDGREVKEIQTGMFSFRGGLGFGRRYLSGPSPDPPTPFSNSDRTGFHFDAYTTAEEEDRYPFTMNPPKWWEQIGFVFKFSADGFNQAGECMEYGVTLPCWFVTALLALVPLSAFASRTIKRRRGKRRTAVGECPSCGYDLRASPRRCPECGRETEPGS